MMSYAKQPSHKYEQLVPLPKYSSDQPLRSQSLQMSQWRHYIERQIGFVLPDEQEQWLINAINDTAARHQLSAVQLWEVLPSEPALNQALLDAVLIPESRFFRHKPSMQFVCEQAYEHQAIQQANRFPYRVWSVGCAMGQEVWSLAMSLRAQGIDDYRITGSDVNQQALNQARMGQYDERQRRLIAPAYQRYVQPIATVGLMPKWQVADELRDQVRFVWHNIFTQDVPMTQLQHLIVCQNMLIYFRQFDQRDILTRLAASCEINGYIVLAPGEALFWRPKNMRRIVHPKVNAWQKISA